MGYTTKFSGKILLDNKLSDKEYDFYTRWSFTRRCARSDFTNGCYFAIADMKDENDYRGQNTKNIINSNIPAEQPSLWCQWVIGKDKKTIRWDGNEKFYASTMWMAYIAEHFFNKNPMAKRLYPEEFGFLNGNNMNGEIYAKGEDRDDVFKIEVVNSKVYLRQGNVPDSGYVSKNNIVWFASVEEIIYEPSDRERKILEKHRLEETISPSDKTRRIKNKL